MRLRILVSTLVFLSQINLCWHSTGHMLVAEMARIKIAETNPDALAWAENLISKFSDFCGEGKHPFTDSATWADKIKEEDWWSMFNWHFVDRVFLGDEESSRSQDLKTGDVLNPSDNAVWAINNCISQLKSNHRSNGNTNPILGKSIALRNLIHFIGDLHQPLHGSTRITKDKPHGDQGGNLFKIKRYPEERGPIWNNLHFVWDHLFDGFKEVWSPLSDYDYQLINDWSLYLLRMYPYSQIGEKIRKNKDAKSWSLESFEIVKNFLYKDLEEDQEIPSDYEKVAKDLVKERLVLASYRLSDTIIDIYNSISTTALT